jgi:hypothetical protein
MNKRGQGGMMGLLYLLIVGIVVLLPITYQLIDNLTGTYDLGIGGTVLPIIPVAILLGLLFAAFRMSGIGGR